MTWFVAIFALLWWSGTEPTLSPGMPVFILHFSPTAHPGVMINGGIPMGAAVSLYLASLYLVNLYLGS